MAIVNLLSSFSGIILIWRWRQSEKPKQMIIWNKKWAIYFVFVFLHTNKDKHENCCCTGILKVIIGIKYIKIYSWN